MRNHRLILGGMTGMILAAGVLGMLTSPAAAQDGAVKVTEADFAAYEKLRYASIVNEERRPFARDDAKKAAIKAEWEAALKTAGWSEDRFREIGSAVDDAANALNDVDKGGEDAAAGKETLASLDKTTVATVQAHRKEHIADEDLRKKAREQVRGEADAERRGAAPDPKALEGKWVFDLDATVASMMPGADAELAKDLRAKMGETMSEATYTFGPGDKIVSTIVQKGTKRTDEGTYRLDGNKLYFKAAGRQRENFLDVGMKDGKLRIGMMGMYSVFKKE